MAVNNFVKTGANSKISISAAPIAVDQPILTDYTTGPTYSLITKASEWSVPQVVYDSVTFTPVATNIKETSKGQIDLGSIDITVGELLTDAGQTNLDAALASKSKFAFKIEHVADGTTTGTILYFAGLVMERKFAKIAPGDLRMITYSVAIINDVIKVAAT